MEECENEYHGYVETFVSWEDAILWAEHRLKPYDINEWQTTVTIKTINGQYRVSVEALYRQKEMALDG